MSVIKFGTDGWRAVISEDFTFENVKTVAQAIADYVKNDCRRLKVRDRRIVIGYDTRFLSDKYAEIVSCVLAANGIKVMLSDRPTPTPSVSFAIKDRSMIGGVMVTASHNPPRYNGIKYKDYYGGSARREVTKKLETYLGESPVQYASLENLKSRGLIAEADIISGHLAFIKRYANIPLIKKSKLKVLVDSMYGTGDGHIAKLLEGGNCKVHTIHNEINPGFGGINPEPIMPNLKELAYKTKSGNYDVGLATDGDADRLGVADPLSGKLLTGHKVMVLLLLHLLEDKKMRGGVIQTICGTALINKICDKYGLKMYETPVGFKHISELMVKEDILIGGEETGGVAFKNSIPERDGILSGLLILEMIAMRRKRLSEILRDIDREYGTYEYRRLDMKYPDEKKQRLMERLKSDPPKKVLDIRVIQVNTRDGYKFICEDSSWLMIRLSGTEPILRVYAEAPTEKKALAILEFGKKLAYSV
ncbi:MAG: phosphoglucomutase/phosphomannomutase family protein [Candidatus Omnitrophica bacterium]|nr:phosphoglucomutase/phosphomannomutase family protein [Candidatus Omnitrophota bacterium]MCM8790815.1 phosphoglucomutase/phosphomannomutase family protein [Candidatus Omnitrophota bacterium]